MACRSISRGKAIMNNKVITDVLFGAVGGFAGTLVLEQVMGFLSRFQSNRDKWIERELVKEEPTQALARRVVQSGFGVELSKERKQQLGRAVQLGYGIAWGAIYGVLRNQLPATSKVAGLPFGVGLGLIGPAVLLPLMDLYPPATEFPVSSHIRGLASHYAYAATVEGVCEALEATESALTSGGRPRKTRPELRRVS